MKNILIFHISEVSGHRKAAEAIRDALYYLYPQSVRVTNIDALRFFHPFAHHLINHLYLSVIRNTPFVWGAIYDKPSVARALSPIKKAIHRNKMKAMSALYRQIKPDAIICTQAFPCGIVADFKREFGVSVPLFGVVTDFHPHRYWVYEEVDYYTVATPDAQKTLSSLEVSESKIKIAGLPIAYDFTSCTIDRMSLGQKFGLDPSVPTVLIMGGGSGLGPINKTVAQLDALPEQFQIIVVCGKNKRLYSHLVKAKRSFKKKTAIFDYVDFVNELMSFSDILITKPGGITIAEALTMDVAIVIVQPIPGQEENNTQVLLKERIAVEAEDLDDVPALVKRFLNEPEYLAAYKKQGKRLSKPDSSIELAELVVNVC